MKQILTTVLLFFLFINLEAQEKSHILTREVVYYKTDSVSVTGFLAYPKDAVKAPGIILIHEWWGLNDDIREKARMFAREGYVALAVDLYRGQSTTEPAEARKLATHVRQHMEEAFDNLKSAIAYLKKMNEVDPNRLATIGWCFGGGWSYQVAKNNLGVKASVIYYGFFNPADDLSKMRAEILGHFAEKDRAIKIDDVYQFQAKLKTLSGDHEIYIYPNTTHGFASRPGKNPNYNPRAAELAWKRTLEFLKKNL